MGENRLLPLPIGISDYRRASTKCYYVDKTLMLKEFLDEETAVSLFTRPRRFGKTLNMDMFRTFFEKTDEDTSRYFKDKKIWACGQEYQEHQGKYPVVFLTFKDVKCETWEETRRSFSRLLCEEFSRHEEMLNEKQYGDADKEYFGKIVGLQAETDELTDALKILSRMLHACYGVAPVIIIDEYDTPIQQGYMNGYYDKVVLFMRNLLSGAFKDNRHLFRGVMTGILRVAKEGIFSGLNNLRVYSILDNRYSQYFGFTHDEVREMTAYYNASSKYEEVCKWYDGYIFGKTSIFNPWSMIEYFDNDCRPQAYWLSTSSNDIIGVILSDANEEIMKNLQKLMQGGSIGILVDTNVIYPELRGNPYSVFSFLLITGYLKVVNTIQFAEGQYKYEVAIPNKEISLVYKREILERFASLIPRGTAIAIQEALFTDNAEAVQTLLSQLLQSVSYYDTAQESFYHGLVLGLCTLMEGRYYVTSNREAGDGRYDIQLMPKTNKFPGVLIEIKAGKNLTQERLEKLSEEALGQIDEKKYDAEMKARDVRKVLKFGVAFSEKRVEVRMRAEG